MTPSGEVIPISRVDNRVPLGRTSTAPLMLDLDRLMAGRMLVQGSSGAGKSQTLRKIIEEAFDYLTIVIVDPEGEFGNLAEHIGATTARGAEISNEGLTELGIRCREHRLPLHVDLSDLEADRRIEKAAAYFAGLLGCSRDLWANTILVCIDEAHLLAPQVASSSRDAEVRRLGVATLTDLCSRGRKRGIATLLATQRLAKLAGSVVSELHNVLIGLNVFDRDVARAADLLGFDSQAAALLRQLAPGEFYAFGPALASTPVLAKIDPPVTQHIGATPALIASAPATAAEARELLQVDSLNGTDTGGRADRGARGSRSLDAFLMEPAAPDAVRVMAALRRIAPNATTGRELAQHLGVEISSVDDALDLLAQSGAIDTTARGEARIARLSAKMRLRAIEAPVVGLA